MPFFSPDKSCFTNSYVYIPKRTDHTSSSANGQRDKAFNIVWRKPQLKEKTLQEKETELSHRINFNLLACQVSFPPLFLKCISEKLVSGKIIGHNVVRRNYTPDVQDLTHSSITSPSLTTRGPASSGGFLRASSSASASASCLLSFSSALTEIKQNSLKDWKSLFLSLYFVFKCRQRT